jgi:hypothetical protein
MQVNLYFFTFLRLFLGKPVAFPDNCRLQYMPVYRIAIPVLLALILALYLGWEMDTVRSILIVLSLALLVLFFLLAPQLNWWWWQRFPPDIRSDLRVLLQRSPFYQQLSTAEQREFRRRLFLFGQGHNLMPQVLEKIPDDVQLILSIPPVAMTFREKEFLFSNFENIIIYPHPFPSPQFPDNFHASEIYEPDGVVMFCTDHLVRGFAQPDQYLNLAWYEYARIFRRTYPQYDFGDWSAVSWEQLEQISKFSKAALERWIGLPDPELPAMGIAFFFLFPQSFQRVLPEQATRLAAIFGTQNA